MKTTALTLTLFFCTALIFLQVSCSRDSSNRQVAANHPSATSGTSSSAGSLNPILNAEKYAAPPAAAILKVGRIMAIEEKAIIKGGCWNWVNTVYKRAGYGRMKKSVFTSRKAGPYADSRWIQPGDWIYYINHSYGGIEHSGIFVYWVDKNRRIGVTLSYGGENRKQPGRYRQYDLRHVYKIVRAER